MQLSEFGSHPPLLWPRKRFLPASGLLMCALTFVQGQFCLLSGKEQKNLPSKLWGLCGSVLQPQKLHQWMWVQLIFVLMFLQYLYWYICSVFWGSIYASGAHKWHSPCRPMFCTLEYVQSRYGWREIIIMIISKVHILKRPWALCRELDGRWRSGLHYKIKRNKYKDSNT